MLVLVSFALAADVLWVGDPPDAQRAAVLAASGGREVDALSVRAAPTDVGPGDDEAIRSLKAALEAARKYETQLDGELIILRDLQRPLDAVELMRNDQDRAAVFAALTYQGFAVDRFFGDALATDEAAAPYRTLLGSLAVETPWLDAVAIEPERRISPYDIAEAPQRVAYGEVQERVLEGLPASIVPGALPRGAVLRVDGRVVTPDATGSVKVAGGRHWVHVAVDDHVLYRWSARVAPGEDVDVTVPLDDATWNAFLADATPGGTVPAEVAAAFDAWGGDGVWLARPGAKRPEVLKVSGGAITAVEVAMATAPGGGGGGSGPPVALSMAVVGGWTGSHDFYYQDPVNTEPTAEAVNAITAGASIGADLQVIGPLRVGLGLDALIPLGESHVARTGDTTMRLRPVPHATVGLRPVALGVGYLFPYHPAVGLRGSAGLIGPLEFRWLGWLGLPSTRERLLGDPYESSPLVTATAGIGVRL